MTDLLNLTIRKRSFWTTDGWWIAALLYAFWVPFIVWVCVECL